MNSASRSRHNFSVLLTGHLFSKKNFWGERNSYVAVGGKPTAQFYEIGNGKNVCFS